MLKILPDSEGASLVVEASGKLTHQDYEAVFIPELNRLIASHGKVRVLLVLTESFDGWELEAMWDDAKFGIKHNKDFEKVAMVGGDKWMEWATKISSYFVSGQMKTYDSSALEEAIKWIKN